MLDEKLEIRLSDKSPCKFSHGRFDFYHKIQGIVIEAETKTGARFSTNLF